MARIRPAAVFVLGCIIGLQISVHLAMAQQEAPAAVKKLMILPGDWRGTGTYTENGKTSQIKAHHKNTLIADGLGVQTIENITGGDMPAYKAVDLFGYDEGEDLVHLYTVDNYGDVHDHKGKWTDDKTLKLRHEGLQKGKKFVEDVMLTFVSPTECRLLDIVSLDGVEFSRGVLTMKKQTGKSMSKAD